MVILSASNYKLPHYIYCVIPFVSVLSAVKIDKWIESEEYFRRLHIMQFFLIIPMLIIVYGIAFFAFGITLSMVIIPFILIVMFLILFCFYVFKYKVLFYFPRFYLIHSIFLLHIYHYITRER